MKQGSYAELKMIKVLCAGTEMDLKTYHCKVLRHDSNGECIYLVLEDAQLTELSLDAVYECSVEENESRIVCTGRIKERYYGESGKIVKLEIKNGFYKISVKSVDK